MQGSSITVDVDGVPAIRRAAPGSSPWRTDEPVPPAPHSVTVEDVEVSGAAADGHAIVLRGAEGSVVRDTVVDSPGPARGGIEATRCGGLVVDGGGLRTSDFAITVVEPDAGADGCRFDIREPPTIRVGNEVSGFLVGISELDGSGCTAGSDVSDAEAVRIANVRDGTVFGRLLMDADDYEGASG